MHFALCVLHFIKSMLLIVGLGNPGKKYEKTRHNVGFMVIDELEKKELPKKAKLLKPETFMNNSGIAVKSAIKMLSGVRPRSETERGLTPLHLIIIHDDIDLPIGKIRISKNRGSGGHRGIESIIKETGTKNFYRIRIGICPLKGKPEYLEKFVLQSFSKEEEVILNKAIYDAVNVHLMPLLQSLKSPSPVNST